MIFGYRGYDRLAPNRIGLACFKIGGDYAMAFGAFVVEIFIAVNSFKESCDFLSFGHIKCKFVCAVFFGGKGMLIHHAHAIVSAEVQLMCQCDLLCVLGQIVFHKSDRLTAIICILGRRMNILTVESHGVEKSVFGLLGNIFHIVFNVLGQPRTLCIFKLEMYSLAVCVPVLDACDLNRYIACTVFVFYDAVDSIFRDLCQCCCLGAVDGLKGGELIICGDLIEIFGRYLIEALCTCFESCSVYEPPNGICSCFARSQHQGRSGYKRFFQHLVFHH